jgi:predicted Ser/Thr protein kinase
VPAPAPASPASPAGAASLIGRRIGAFQVTREIGRGGMGIVYLAHDMRLGRDVAIKALPRDLPADGRRRERLRREARAAAALAHPNIAVVYALEEEGDEIFLVTEYVRGRTLRDELADGALPPARLIDTAIEITRAVGAAHEEGIVHRDLKPDNVMRTPTGAIKILDFGLARAMVSWADEDLATLTRSGTLLGTPAYMAPEQIRGGRVDARTDLFAVGVMFYELASGVHPFDGTAVGLTLHRILTEAPVPLASRGVLAPPGFWPVIERCLEKDPDLRYAAAGDLLVDLLRVQATVSGVGIHGTPLPPSGEQAGRFDSTAASGAAAFGVQAPLRESDGRPSPLAPGDEAAARVSAVEAESASRSSQWWWRFHQLAVAAFLAAAVVPAWRIWGWIPQEWLRGALRVATLVVVAVGVSLRLHLWFLSRYDPAGLPEQRPRASPWIRGADAGFVVAMLVGALTIMPQHPGTGALFLGLGICYAVVFLMIEPATTRSAFRER